MASVALPSPPELEFDWRNPVYAPIYLERMRRLRALRENPKLMIIWRAWYKDHPADFINDWGVTVDPRNADIGLPVIVPFLLFPKQRDWVSWVVERWRAREPGLSDKSRDWGLSWLAVSTAATLSMFHDDLITGFGSRKEEYVDKIGSPKSLFWKAREFIKYVPPEFSGGWDSRRDSAHMRISFPMTGSVMTGEAGDNIGRGDRAAIYFVDEEAYLERAQLVEQALSQTTNCRISISSANGMANPFAEKRFSGRISVFTCHWRDDPRKDQAWYDKQCAELDPVTIAQEIDINYAASVEGVLIPSEWIAACINACEKLGITPTGERRGAMDVADEGKDKNAFACATGVEVDAMYQWSGKGSDIYASTEKAFGIADDEDVESFLFDSDGLGADVRGNARVINERRAEAKIREITVSPFRGSAEVFMPEGEDVPGRKNKDFFRNRKAQSWWTLRRRAYKTFRAVVHGDDYEPDDIISFNQAGLSLPRPGYPQGLFTALIMELAQPTYKKDEIGKIVVNKTPDNMPSPNLADTVMIIFGRAYRTPMVVTDETLSQI